jgi:hypothetical protein
MYNAKPFIHGLTDMGHIWYKGLKDIGFDGLTLRSPH